MDIYVFHLYFYFINIDVVDIILGYPRMDLVDTIDINVYV